MRKIKDVLRLKLDAKLSHQQIADALGLSKGVVTKYVGLAAAAGLDWTAVQSMDEAALERRLGNFSPRNILTLDQFKQRVQGSGLTRLGLRKLRLPT